MILQMIYDSTDRYFHKTAVVDNTGAYTYSQLKQDVNQLAAVLQSKGIGKGDRVGIYTQRGYLAVVALLGVLGAGAAYIPISRNLPEERIKTILRKSTPVAVLTNTKVPSDLFESIDLSIPELLAEEERLYNPTFSKKEDFAYILYTSGSTGEPKGVCISHEAADFFIRWSIKEFSLSDEDRIVSLSSLAFDLSIFEIFSCLAAGATVYFAPQDIKRWPADFVRFISENQITVLYAVPSFLNGLATYGNISKYRFNKLRLILFAGEPYWVYQFNKLKRLLPSNIEYANLYGPTETNVCTFYRIPQQYSDKHEFPIGKPLPGVEYRILRKDKKDAFGELVIFGPCVMTGYWGDSYTGHQEYWFYDNGKRGYKTGDIVSEDEVGTLRLLGRKDDIVKVNGYRVSLNEIKKTIAQHPKVINVCACLRRQVSLSEIVAFICVDKTFQKEHIQEIRSFCSQKLPSYMIPNIIKAVSQFPLTDSGKIDVRKLMEGL